MRSIVSFVFPRPFVVIVGSHRSLNRDRRRCYQLAFFRLSSDGREKEALLSASVVVNCSNFPGSRKVCSVKCQPLVNSIRCETAEEN